MKTYAIIPSGGKGKRINSPTPKQYLKIGGKEIIAYTLEVFQQSNMVDEIVVAAEEEFFDQLNDVKDKYAISKLRDFVPAGKERQDSVMNALFSLPAEPDDLVLVHDAVRPLLSSELLNRVIDNAKISGSTIAAIKAKDTLVKGGSEVEAYIQRDNVYYVQTPQTFRFSILEKAMKSAQKENYLGTDESMLVRRIGEKIAITEGSSLNFKITTESDLELFHLINSRF